MRYLLVFLMPPAAVLLCRRPGQAVLNVLLTACFYLPGAAHALLVARDTAARERADRVADAVLAREETLSRQRRQARVFPPIPSPRYARLRA
jgi:uncharacterized membrane protein YqaE (UPF0057 family)